MLDLEIELEKAKAEERAYMEIEKENRSTHSDNLQKDPQLPPSQKINQTPVQGCSVDKKKHEQETLVKHQPLNPNATEWPRIFNPGSQLTLNNANEGGEPNLTGNTLHSSHTAYLMNMQSQQNQQLERLMIEQQRYTAVLSLPQPEFRYLEESQ